MTIVILLKKKLKKKQFHFELLDESFHYLLRPNHSQCFREYPGLRVLQMLRTYPGNFIL